MNKGDLISKIAEEANLSKAQAQEALEATLGAISETLQNGNRASLIGFGTFSVTQRNARVGRNPQTGESINIPAKTVVKFKPGKDLTSSVN
jgi:DNA-binding protein HU-beta